MLKKRYLLKNKNGISTVLEAVVAVGISVTLLIGFFYSTNNLFTTQKDPAENLEAKSIGFIETLISSPGQNIHNNPDWSGDSVLLEAIGLGTSRTTQWGGCSIDANGNLEIVSGPFPHTYIGESITCFLSGTKIVMADESYKNIEDIVIDDMVKSYDERNKMIVDKKVAEVFHHSPDEMDDYYLVINDQLRVTPNHQFYINGEWRYADELTIGDSLFYPSSEFRVFSIEKVYEKTETYNFEVEGNHNYFVAMEPTSVLVHNAERQSGSITVEWYDGYPDPTSGAAPLQVHFKIEVSGSTGPFSITWNWGDGESNSVRGATGSVFEADHTYQNPPDSGTYYTATVMVFKDLWNWGYVNEDIYVWDSTYSEPIPDFTWFDADGPYDPNSGKKICFDASSSILDTTPIVDYKWTIEGMAPQTIQDNPIWYPNYNFNVETNVILNLTDAYLGSSEVTKTVKANSPNDPDPESRPWVLAGKNIQIFSDEDSFLSYPAGYRVKLTLKGEEAKSYYMFEVKETASSDQYILDSEKIEKLDDGSFNYFYKDIKNIMGLNSSTTDYNFRIEIKISGTALEYSYGASDDTAVAVESTKRDVLVYYPPDTDDKGIITKFPYYLQAEITLYIFIGGTPPI